MFGLTQLRAAWHRRQAIATLHRLAVVGSDAIVAPSFRCVAHSAAAKSMSIGHHVSLDGLFATRRAGRIVIGDYCSFRANTYIGAILEVRIGSHVFGADGVYICDNNNHPTSPRRRREMTLSPPDTAPWKWDAEGVAASPICIEDCVWLGRQCMILKGVTIGRGSIVAAGAIVTKSVPPFSVVAGNPARVVKTLENDLD